jgi:hypothetical protein
MGKALVLLATSCAALSTGRHGPTRSMGRTNTMLHYRDLNEYEVINTAEPRTNEAKATKIDIKIATPHTRRIIRRPTVQAQDEQIVMDEYLEYVEKRYSRMHRRKSMSKPLAFVLPTKMISTIMYQPADNEALQALGLTGLISERLRTRLHAPREFRNEHESAVNFFHYFSPKEVEKRLKQDEANAVAAGRLSPHVSLSFVAQFSLMMESLRKVMMAYMTSLKVMGSFFVRAVPAVLEKGGLRHSIRMMSVASVAILLMFRPLFRGFMKQA